MPDSVQNSESKNDYEYSPQKEQPDAQVVAAEEE